MWTFFAISRSSADSKWMNACVQCAICRDERHTSHDVSKQTHRMTFIGSYELNANNYINGFASIIHTLQLVLRSIMRAFQNDTSNIPKPNYLVHPFWTFARLFCSRLKSTGCMLQVCSIEIPYRIRSFSYVEFTCKNEYLQVRINTRITHKSNRIPLAHQLNLPT